MTELDREWETISIDDLRQLDAVCDRFEQAWDHDPTTRIEAFLVDLTEAQQRLLVRELVPLEIEKRYSRGDAVAAREYASRFPQWADELVEQASRTIHELDCTADDTVDDILSAVDTATRPATVLPHAPSFQQPFADAPVQQREELATADTSTANTLGHYEIQGVIGRGGMGVVLRAHDRKLGREVALKVLAPELATDPKAQERFLLEARAAASIRHNNVVQIHAVETGQRPFMVMELVKGTTLDKYLETRGKLEPTEVLALAIQMALGLSASHQQGLVHRDVKPANILLEKPDVADGKSHFSEWRVKLTDFGLVRITSESRLTSSGLIGGTPHFMSPEQANGQQVDKRSDLFSLGSVMYLMCTGRMPFDADSALAIVRQVADTPARAVRELSPETPRWLVSIINKLMDKSPEKRFQSAGELVESLDQHMSNSSSKLPTDGLLTAGSRDGWLTPPTVKLFSGVALAGTAIAAGVWGLAFKGGSDVAGLNAGNSGNVDRSELASTNDNDRDELRAYEWPEQAPEPAVTPFDADQARIHQEQWAEYLNIEIETENTLGMKLALIPPGEFLMGSEGPDIQRLVARYPSSMQHVFYNENPRHRIIVTEPFLIATCEITRGQFRSFVDDAKYVTEAEKDDKGGFGMVDDRELYDPKFIWSSDPGFEQTDDHPVLNVTWNDATAFCEWLSKREGVTYRLPTEAEWEYACRAGTVTSWCFGDNPDLFPEYGWFGIGYGGKTNPVRSLKPNPWGLYDMHGSVWEWCADRFDANYYERSPEVDPTGSEDAYDRVYRGGAWYNPNDFCRSATRFWGAPNHRSSIGIRVARTVAQSSS